MSRLSRAAVRKSRSSREGSLLNRNEEEMTFMEQEIKGYKQVICQPASLLLVFVPFGFMGRTMEWNSAVVFIVNFLAVIGMANVQFRAVECVSMQVSPTVGGMIDAFLGKSVEQVMAIQCLRAGLPNVLQANLMGSMHWCLLLVLGMSIFAAGVKKKTCKFNVDGAAAQMSCQIVCAISITLPTMFGAIPGVTSHEVMLLSRVCAIILIFLYICFIYFHLKTHKAQFLNRQTTEEGLPEHQVTAEDQELSRLSLGSSIFLMISSIVITTLNSQVLVDNILDLSKKFEVPLQFIGATMLPILGNTAEHVASVSHAMKDEMDTSIAIALGSALQIALFVVPLSVIYGWAFDRPMSLNFSMYDSAVMLLGTFLVAQILQHGSSNWLHGAMMMMVYLMVGVISYYPVE